MYRDKKWTSETSNRKALVVAIWTGLLTLLLVSTGLAQEAETCGVCHQTIHKEWLLSRHAQASRAETFKQQLEAFGSLEFCGSCHAPASIWKQVDMIPPEEKAKYSEPTAETPLPAPVFKAVLNDSPPARGSMPDEGVTCTSCHYVEIARPEGTAEEAVGPYHSESGHGGIEVPLFRSYRLCGACHARPPADYVPPEGQVDDRFHHRRNIDFDFAFQRSDCSNCHMPRRSAALLELPGFKTPERLVGAHTFSGQRYEQLQDALEMTIESAGEWSFLSISNAKIGHPLRISATSTYELVVYRLGEGEPEEVSRLEFEGASELQLGQNDSIPIRLQMTHSGSIRVELYLSDGDQTLKVASKDF